MSLKLVKNKIIATEKTGKVTKAMEAVSAVKMRKSQERALSGKTYAEAAMRILYRVSKSRDIKTLLNGRVSDGSGRDCFIVITSDKGLAGSLNSSVLKETDIALQGLTKENIRIIAFGRKATEHYSRNGYTLDREYTNVSDDVSLDDMEDVTQFVKKAYDEGNYDNVYITYQSFVSTFEQTAVLRKVLPLDPLVIETIVKDIVPKTGVFSDTEKELDEHSYTVEPSADEVMVALIPKLMQILLYHALLESKASEHSARMVAMKNATDKAKEMTKALTLVFNKKRQAAITAEVSEITGGIEAMKN